MVEQTALFAVHTKGLANHSDLFFPVLVCLCKEVTPNTLG